MEEAQHRVNVGLIHFQGNTRAVSRQRLNLLAHTYASQRLNSRITKEFANLILNRYRRFVQEFIFEGPP